MLLTLGGAFADPGASAFDTCAESSLPMMTNGTVNTSVAGEYDITYSSVTGGGVMGSATRAVVVIDPAATVPEISLNLDFGAATDTNQAIPSPFPPDGACCLSEIFMTARLFGAALLPQSGRQ